MVASAGRTPWRAACVTHSNADGPGAAITAPARETNNNQVCKDMETSNRQRSAPCKAAPAWQNTGDG
ncbi:hypothetical protein CT3_19790 [Comamonas terrigena NBRC 13299]|nr:hypothetical protein CT3_19790 [Comamonas terrigena NBRC 13299]